MNGEAIQQIVKLAEKGFTVERDGVIFSPTKMEPILYDLRPEPLNLNTLTGLVDYIKANIDDVELSKCLLHVESHDSVKLISRFYGESQRRDCLIKVQLDNIECFPFDRFIDYETFNIQLRSKFEMTSDLGKIIQVSGKIDVENSIKLADDGISQQVAVKKGLSGAIKEEKMVPSMVSLKPYRTFSEVEQPESDFLFRLKQTDSGVLCALFEADGGKWRSQARKSIKRFLKIQLPHMSIIS